MDQPDYLVVGCLGMLNVGKSTIMSILAGTKTGSDRSVEYCCCRNGSNYLVNISGILEYVHICININSNLSEI